MTGFELLKEFDVSRSVIWPAPQNEVYRVLAGLADDGLIEEHATGPRGARRYAITQAGRAALRYWLAAPSDYTLRYEPILKAVFLRSASSEVRCARAEADLIFFADQLAKLEAAQAPSEARADARRMAMGFYRAMRDWAEAILSAPTDT